MYKLLKNAIIKGDRRLPPDLCTLADITECAVLNNYLYFRGALWIPNFEPLRMVIIDRRCVCSGRIHYKITLVLCLQVGQMLSLIELNRTMFCMRGCLIHELPHISTEHLGSLGM